MKNKIHLIILLFISSIISAKASVATNSNLPGNEDEFEVLMQKIRLDFAKNPSIDEALKKYNETDGSFSDV